MKAPRWAPAIFLLACSRYSPPPSPAPRDATQVRAPAATTWDALIEVFGTHGIPIRSVDPGSGLLVTDELRVGREGRESADCGKAGGERLAPNFARYNALVRGDALTSTVKVTAVWSHQGGKRTVNDCATTNHFEQALEDEVQQRAESGGQVAGRGPGGAGRAAPGGPPRGPGSSETLAPLSLTDSLAYPPRPNNELLANPNFSRVVGDMDRKGLLLTYREVGGQRLLVDLSATALMVPSIEYELTQLFLAYANTMIDDTNPTLVLRANGSEAGHYTRAGLEWTGDEGRR
jgi:hypothetical protein